MNGCEEKVKLCFRAMVVEDRTMWFFSFDFNGLFEMNLDTGKVQYLGSVPGEAPFGKKLYINMMKVGEELVLVPKMAKQLAVYHIQKHTFRMKRIITQKRGGFGGSCVWKRNIYILGHLVPMIAKIDLDTLEIERYSEYENIMRMHELTNQEVPFLGGYMVIDHMCYFVTNQSNILYEFDMREEQLAFWKVGEHLRGFKSVCFDGKDFYFLEWDKPVLLRWNTNEGTLWEYDGSGVLGPNYNGGNIFAIDGQIWMFPFRGNEVTVVNIQLDEFTVRKDFQWCELVGKKEGNFTFLKTCYQEGSLYIHVQDANKLMEYRVREHCIAEYLLAVDTDVWKQVKGSHIRNEMIVKENENIKLEDLITTLGMEALC